MLRQSHPEVAKKLLEETQRDVWNRWKTYEAWANLPASDKPTKSAAEKTGPSEHVPAD